MLYMKDDNTCTLECIICNVEHLVSDMSCVIYIYIYIYMHTHTHSESGLCFRYCLFYLQRILSILILYCVLNLASYFFYVRCYMLCYMSYTLCATA